MIAMWLLFLAVPPTPAPPTIIVQGVDPAAQWAQVILTAVAIIAASVIAFGLQRNFSRDHQIRTQRLGALHTLVSNRYQLFSQDRIRVLNSIDLLFSDSPGVRKKFRDYMNAVGQPDFATNPERPKEAGEAGNELILAIAENLGLATTYTADDVKRWYGPKYVWDQFTLGQ